MFVKKTDCDIMYHAETSFRYLFGSTAIATFSNVFLFGPLKCQLQKSYSYILTSKIRTEELFRISP